MVINYLTGGVTKPIKKMSKYKYDYIYNFDNDHFDRADYDDRDDRDDRDDDIESEIVMNNTTTNNTTTNITNNNTTVIDDIIVNKTTVIDTVVNNVNVTDNIIDNNVQTKNYIYGTRRKDYLTGTDLDDVIYGYNGNDTLIGGLGADVLKGGKGKNKYSSAPDNATDYIYIQKDNMVDKITSIGHEDRVVIKGNHISIRETHKGIGIFHNHKLQALYTGDELTFTEFKSIVV
jgi:Ca2+-binding RTX toxin-like protein